jgi:D-psicose/D-tagatose/L-ribulose 3-epimerase
MELQNFEKKNLEIREKFKKLLDKKGPFKNKLKFSWSNWGFGLEPVEVSIERLAKNGIKYIELSGNQYSRDLGYNSKKINKLLSRYGMKTSGICGLFSTENELAHTSPYIRQRAIEYVKRTAEFGGKVGAEYFLIVPGAVGRPVKYDDYELERVIELLKQLGDVLLENNIKGAIEPIRADEVAFVHTFQEAVDLIDAVDHKGIQHINADVYHMLHGESHIGQALLDHGDRIVNVHLADTDRKALGSAMFDLDTFLMVMYLNGYNDRNVFCTAEPLGPGADPYQAMNGLSDPKILDDLVKETAEYFYWREEEIMKIGSG